MDAQHFIHLGLRSHSTLRNYSSLQMILPFLLKLLVLQKDPSYSQLALNESYGANGFLTHKASLLHSGMNANL